MSQASSSRVMPGGLLAWSPFFNGACGKNMVTQPSASCGVGVWTSCRSAPCQEMVRRKEEKNSAAEERWRVVVPQEEAWMTQSSRLF